MSQRQSGDSGNGDEEERVRYRELLDELRTIIPGVQVLLAFLLTVPFSARFPELDPLSEALFVVTLATATLSVIVFLIPTVYHRLSDDDNRRRRLHVGVRSMLAGLTLLGGAMMTALGVVIRLIYAGPAALAITAAMVLALVALWVVLPFVIRRCR